MTKKYHLYKQILGEIFSFTVLLLQTTSKTTKSNFYSVKSWWARQLLNEIGNSFNERILQGYFIRVDKNNLQLILTNTSYQIPQEQLLIRISLLFILTFWQKIPFRKTDWDNEDIALHLLDVYNRIITLSICVMQWLQ